MRRSFGIITLLLGSALAFTGGCHRPEPLTPEGTGCRYANGLFDAARKRWIGVREEHAADGRVENTLVAVGLEAPGAGRILARDTIFVPRRRCRRTAGGSPG